MCLQKHFSSIKDKPQQHKVEHKFVDVLILRVIVEVFGCV